MRQFLLVTVFLISSIFLFAQRNSTSTEKEIATNSFFAEAGGPGIAFSANIDKRFTNSHIGFGGRLGIGFVSADEMVYNPSNGYYDYNQTSAITLPLQLNYIFGKLSSPHSFEIGAGVTYISKKLEIMNFYEDMQTQVFGTFAFMYRRQPANGGFSWRIGFTPIFAKSYIQPFGAASVGYNF
ncbi:MAG TPA: hypothetical protein VGQ09_20090 [Chitinophagaceae bacterium]|jgi:hypothetical protein|nr:hypothetical protein [Chitinophagaceae bacterium]